MEKKKRLEFFENIDREIKKLKEKTIYQKNIPDLQQAIKKLFYKSRVEFFKNFGATQMLWAAASKTAREYITLLAFTGESEIDLTKLEGAEKYLAQLHKAETEFGLEITGELTESGFPQALSKRIESTASKILQDVIKGKIKKAKSKKSKNKYGR